MIPYDQEFLMATLPTTPKGTATVTPGLENQQVPIRYDPFDVGTAYAFVEGRWVQCHSEYYTILHGHSERELMIVSNELRRRQQCHSQGLAITAKKLAGFLQSVEAEELLMAQRLRDQEAQPTRSFLSLVPSMPSFPAGVDGESVKGNAVAVDAEAADSNEIYGEF
jgi:hypothetical protein